MTTTASRVLCVWIPNWPIQRLVVDRPELRRQQVVTFKRDSRRGQLITAVSPLAKRTGVCVGMPLSEAKSLLRRGSGRHDFHVLEQNLNQDVAAIESLCQSLENFSPIVGLETIDPLDFKHGKRPDSLMLDITGLGHLFGDETELARSLVKNLHESGYHVFAAIADTVGSAWAAAHYLAAPFFKEHHQPLVIAPAN